MGLLLLLLLMWCLQLRDEIIIIIDVGFAVALHDMIIVRFACAY
jgi:hypothetical protein